MSRCPRENSYLVNGSATAATVDTALVNVQVRNAGHYEVGGVINAGFGDLKILINETSAGPLPGGDGSGPFQPFNLWLGASDKVSAVFTLTGAGTRTLHLVLTLQECKACDEVKR